MAILVTSVACVERELDNHSADDVSRSTAPEEIEAVDDSQDSEPAPGIDVDIVMPSAQIGDVVGESDVVIRGTVVDLEEDVRGELSTDPTAGYTYFAVRIEETLAGAPAETLTNEKHEVRVGIMTHAEGQQIGALESGEPVDLDVGTTALWFLTEVDAEFDFDGYALAHFYGVVVKHEDGTLWTRNPNSSFGQEVADLGSLEAVKGRVREALERLDAGPVEYQPDDIELPEAGVDDLVNVSEVVVYGTLRGLEEHPGPRGLVRPGHSVFTLEVNELLAGELVQTFSSGTIGISMMTHHEERQIQEFAPGGSIHFEVGDKAIWFLNRDNYHVTAMYALSHFYGLVPVSDDGTLRSRDPDSSFGQEIAELETLDALEERIRKLQ